MKSKNTHFLFFALVILLLLADLGFSFYQYLAFPLDGDLAEVVLPFPSSEIVLKNPLGWDAIVEHKTYHNTNRFFCHWTFYEYFNRVPLLLQNFMSPLESMYWAAALFKLFTHLSLLLLLSYFVNSSFRIGSVHFWAIALLITPFFQTHGYYTAVGIVDAALTYVFFYAFPAILLLLLYIPIFQRTVLAKASGVNFLLYPFWLILLLACCLSGPLNAPIIIIYGILYYLNEFFKKPQISPFVKSTFTGSTSLAFIIPSVLMAIYSFYLGTFNSTTISSQKPLTELYLRLFKGLWLSLSENYAIPLILFALIFNFIFINLRISKQKNTELNKGAFMVFAFSLLYLLMLPLGGYREYRPYIVRYDTIMPLTLILITSIAYSSFYIFKNAKASEIRFYLPALFSLLLLFTYFDRAKPALNSCEKEAITVVAAAKTDTVFLEQNCNVMGWTHFKERWPAEMNAKLLLRLNVIPKETIFLHKN